MAISQDQKVDLLFKKVAFGVAKTDLATNKSPSNESIPSRVPTFGSDIWAEDQSIPAVAPSVTSSIVEVYLQSESSALTLTEDATATNNRSWLSNLTDWIPFSFHPSYAVKVYKNSVSLANQLFIDGSGNDDEWYFDYEAGVLNFIGDNLPITNSDTIIIEGYRYIGNKGLTGPGGGVTDAYNTISDGVSTQVASGNDTLTFTGGEGVNATVGATNTVTFDLDINGLSVPSAGFDPINDQLAIFNANDNNHRKISLGVAATLTSFRKDSNSTVAITNTDGVVICTNAGVRTVNLPLASTFAVGQTIIIKDGAGTATVSNITINANSSDLIDGQSTQLINIEYEGYKLVSDGVSEWFII